MFWTGRRAGEDCDRTGYGLGRGADDVRRAEAHDRQLLPAALPRPPISSIYSLPTGNKTPTRISHSSPLPQTTHAFTMLSSFGPKPGLEAAATNPAAASAKVAPLAVEDMFSQIMAAVQKSVRVKHICAASEILTPHDFSTLRSPSSGRSAPT